jgi:hypothetical protein
MVAWGWYFYIANADIPGKGGKPTMKTMLTLLAFLTLATTNAAALEACNRYDDNVDECYENYYRNASNYNYDRHRDCRMIDGYQQCGGDNEPRVAVQNARRTILRDHCWYDRYAGKMVCENPYRN